MQKFEKISYINCKLDDLFDFHLDVNNLKKITPRDTKVELLTKEFKPDVGKILTIKTTKSFISTIWEVRIDKLDKPNILVDVAIKSPFNLWKHSHIFKQKDNYCELKDEVIFKLPFGFLGGLFNFIVIKQLEEMFDFRHSMTKKILESK